MGKQSIAVVVVVVVVVIVVMVHFSLVNMQFS